MSYFKYGKKEIEYLKEKDPILGREIDRIGMLKRETDPDIFSSLISSIISQQISTKAAITVKRRFVDLMGKITPENIDSMDINSIQRCGMSMRKADYIKGIAEAAISNRVDFANLYKMTDGEIIRELTVLRGVGEWTAEMLLIHSLKRPDVISYKDLGIRKGLMILYDIDDITKKQFQIYKDRYTPYCTVASIYIWEIFRRLQQNL